MSKEMDLDLIKQYTQVCVTSIFLKLSAIFCVSLVHLHDDFFICCFLLLCHRLKE